MVAGFGKIAWADAESVLLSEPAVAELSAAEAGIVDHMNEDHVDAIFLYATVLAGAKPGAWRMTGVDMEGLDLTNGRRVLRMMFESPVQSATDARLALVALVKKAREIGG